VFNSVSPLINFSFFCRGSDMDIHPNLRVVGSDGNFVGTVEKIDGDLIMLARTHVRAGGLHHWLPLAWVCSVEDVVTLDRDSVHAQREWLRSPSPPEPALA
jgi:hypothetical protein